MIYVHYAPSTQCIDCVDRILKCCTIQNGDNYKKTANLFLDPGAVVTDIDNFLQLNVCL